MRLYSKIVKSDKFIYKFLGVKFTKKILDYKKIVDTEYSIIAKEYAYCTRINRPYFVHDISIGKGTYIASNSNISHTSIGKFCSIGPNFMCGYGIHPTNTISSSPCFYSTKKQNGFTFSKIDKIQERLPINIGNDVFIGMNVCVLDGINIGDGAIIGAGAVVTKDIPPYAIAVGVPAKIIKYRFSPEIIEKLLQLKWWNWEDDKLKNVEEMLFDVDNFVSKYGDYND